MNKKQLRDIAIVVIVIFAITIVVYPLIFGTDVKPDRAHTPVELPSKNDAPGTPTNPSVPVPTEAPPPAAQ